MSRPVRRVRCQVAPAPAPKSLVAANASPSALPPEGMHPDAGRTPLPTPPGASPDQVAQGDQIFHGVVSNGSLAALTETIETGVPHPKKYQGVMPPLGGAPLSKADVAAVAAFVWAVGHRSESGLH